MRRLEDKKMRRCEDEKMRRCDDRPPVLEEPFAQTLSEKKVLTFRMKNTDIDYHSRTNLHDKWDNTAYPMCTNAKSSVFRFKKDNVLGGIHGESHGWFQIRSNCLSFRLFYMLYPILSIPRSLVSRFTIFIPMISHESRTRKNNKNHPETKVFRRGFMPIGPFVGCKKGDDSSASHPVQRKSHGVGHLAIPSVPLSCACDVASPARPWGPMEVPWFPSNHLVI